MLSFLQYSAAGIQQKLADNRQATAAPRPRRIRCLDLGLLSMNFWGRGEVPSLQTILPAGRGGTAQYLADWLTATGSSVPLNADLFPFLRSCAIVRHCTVSLFYFRSYLRSNIPSPTGNDPNLPHRALRFYSFAGIILLDILQRLTIQF